MAQTAVQEDPSPREPERLPDTHAFPQVHSLFVKLRETFLKVEIRFTNAASELAVGPRYFQEKIEACCFRVRDFFVLLRAIFDWFYV